MIIGGLDEVGWGALAGPIISVIAVFRSSDLALLPSGVTDSKKLSKKAREAVYDSLIAASYDVGIGHAFAWEIDTYSPAEALHLSYRRAWSDIHEKRRPELLIVDGDKRARGIEVQQQIEPKADLNHQQVSAASIIAKVFRDRLMDSLALDRRKLGLPDYDWGNNSGYGSPSHLAAIKQHGLVIPDEKKLGGYQQGKSYSDDYQHRKSYCRNLILNPA